MKTSSNVSHIQQCLCCTICVARKYDAVCRGLHNNVTYGSVINPCALYSSNDLKSVEWTNSLWKEAVHHLHNCWQCLLWSYKQRSTKSPLGRRTTIIHQQL